MTMRSPMAGATTVVLGTLLWMTMLGPAAVAEDSGGAQSEATAIEAMDEATASAEVEHPEKAICRTCSMRGSQHGEEDVADVRERAGRFYYFCAKPCAEAFDAFPAAYEDKVYPRPAPAATLVDLEGSSIELAKLFDSGDVILLDFWATWCKPCEKTMPEIQQLHDELGAKGLRILGVSIDEKGPGHVREWTKKKDFDYPMAVDTSDSPAWFHYGVPAVPALFLIDRKGQIVAEWKGMIDMEEVRPKIEEQLAATVE